MVVAYHAVSESTDWMARLEASKIVIVDFGGRSNSLDEMPDAIKMHGGLDLARIVIINVGTQQKVWSSRLVSVTL